MENSDSLSGKVHCRIRLEIGENKIRRKPCMKVELQGTEDRIHSAIFLLEESLLDLLGAEEQGRALYYMGLLNEYRFKSDIAGREKVVHQLCCHQPKKEMKYIYCKSLPGDCSDYLGITIGANGKNKKRMMKETKCNIEINPKTDCPHYVIYGDSVGDVKMCAKQMEKSLMDAKKLKQGRGKKVNARRRHTV
jgi:hypothetical protein